MPFIKVTDDTVEFRWGQIVFGILGFVVASIAISWFVFGYNVLTASPRGRGDAHIQKEGASNRIAAQAVFVNDLTSIVKFNQQYIDALKAVEDWDKANAGKQDNAIGTLANQRQNLVDTANGIRQQCQNVIADYNRAGASYLSRDFKDEELPDRIGINDFCQGRPVPTYPGLQKLGLQ